MKKTFQYILAIAFMTAFLVSCDPDDDTPDDTDPRDKFVGNWTCSETSTQSGTIAFTVYVTLNSSNTSQIYLANFYQLGTSQKLYAVVAGDNATAAEQLLNGFSIKGSGSITTNNTKMNWNYYVNDGSDIDTCTAVFTKQ